MLHPDVVGGGQLHTVDAEVPVGVLPVHNERSALVAEVEPLLGAISVAQPDANVIPGRHAESQVDGRVDERVRRRGGHLQRPDGRL